MNEELSVLELLAEINRFLDQARPIAIANAKTACYLGSEHEDELFGYCADFCEECAWMVANRVSSALELAYAWLGRWQPRLACALWQTRHTWMDLNNPRGWSTTCEIHPRQSPTDTSSLEYCDECGVLLDAYADPCQNEEEWSYWAERAQSGDVNLDNDDIAHLYYLLHESSDYSEDGRSACQQWAALIKAFSLGNCEGKGETHQEASS